MIKDCLTNELSNEYLAKVIPMKLFLVKKFYF